ncbi:MAG: hydroxymethylglutaryl-CoA reductase [Phycisphaeraceae bacterium]|nr:hydroxymethylglutaryl-CoA reductase [Phycisphaeraceae bacterium]
MATDIERIRRQITTLMACHTPEELAKRLEQRTENVPPRVPGGSRISPSAIERRWSLLGDRGDGVRDAILDSWALEHAGGFERNIEQYIGTAKIPIGLAGPLRINGLFGQGDYYFPLATTEAALVASYSRGAALITEAGGCASMMVGDGVARTPGFAFANLEQVGRFVLWLTANMDQLKRIGEGTTRYGTLVETRLTIEGNHVYLSLEYRTGDAAGQNMVTIATQAIFDHILANCPIKPAQAYVEANASGDKKATMQALVLGRGRKVTSEITLTADLVRRRLHTTPEQMSRYWQMSALGGVLSGGIGVQGHYANGLAALFIACGQDVACVAEAAVGVTRFEVTSDGDLYAAVTLPNMVVGTVGGGTALPSQKACLELLGLSGASHGHRFAELCGGVCLAGELSIIGALAAGEFSRAHARLARGKRIAATPAPEPGDADSAARSDPDDEHV